MPTSLPPQQRQFFDRLFELERSLAPPATESDGLDDFRALIMARWETLHWRLLGTTTDGLRNLSTTQHALLQALVDSPDLLAPLERGRDEPTHTRLIAWFLRRDGAVGDACRRALANQLNLDPNTVLLDVHTELNVAAGCRVDIVLETRRHLIYVEAKVDADERPNQLADYHSALVANAGKRKPVLVFLTVDPPDQASADHIPLSFQQLLAAWLPAVLLPGADARYLASYLVSVASSLCSAAEPGPFAGWSLGAQHRMLDLLQTIEEAHVH